MIRFLNFVLLYVSFVGLSETALSQRICTRDYAADGMDICAIGASPKHKYIKSEVPGRKDLCAITYEDSNCKFHKDSFAHAKTARGEIVCVLNYNQPDATGNYCVIDPTRYLYANDPWL